MGLIATWLLCGTAAAGIWDEDEEDVQRSSSYNGPGYLFRAAHIEGQGIPQVRPLSPFELFPYLMVDDSLFFADLRFYPTNDLHLGGNAGVGYRYFSSDWDRVFGISAWYDADNARNVYFQQLGLSLETYAGPLDFRTNLYLPVGTTQRQTSLTYVNGSAQFVGDNIAYDQVRTWYSAMKGLDMEAGIPLPGEFADDHGVRFYGGWYHFQDNHDNSITGASTRLIANLFDGFDAQVQVTYDSFYDVRAFFGISWTFGALRRSELSQKTAFGRMGEHVTRNYTVVAPLRSDVEHKIAVDPGTGAAYRISHVSSAAGPGGDGTISSPFQTIAAAQAAGRDIVFVHSGSVFNGADASIVLSPGQRIYGDSVDMQHFIRIPELNTLQIPHGPNVGSRPLLNGAAVDSVVLASNSEFAGFSIANAGGSGIVGNGISGAVVRGVSINQVGIDGIQMLNTTGLNQIIDVSVADAVSGILVQGGAGQTRFFGTTTVSQTTGPAVSIHDLTSGGAVSFENLIVANRLGRGLEIDNVAGSVAIIGSADISNGAGSVDSAIDVRNSSGNFGFNRVNVADSTGAAGVNLQDNTGTTSFETLNITSQNGTALRANNGGVLAINRTKSDGTVDLSHGGAIVATGGTAVDLEDTDLHVNLTAITSTNTATGIRMVDTTGEFATYGNGTQGSGGTIQNTTTGIFLQNVGATAFQWLQLDSNTTGIHADNVSNLLVLHSTINNSTNFGIDAINTTALVVGNSSFSGNGAANIRAQFDELRTYSYSIVGSQFTSATADNVVFNLLAGAEGSTLNLLSQTNTFTNSLTGTAALNVNWNGNLAAVIQQSGFTASGGSNAGVRINNASASGLSSVTMANSTFLGTGGTDTGFFLTTAGAAQVNLVSNIVEFDGTNSTGFRMTLGPSSTVSITGNTIFDNSDGTTGILFDSLTGPGSVRIENNRIDLLNLGGLLDRGIIFSSITNTIQLQGTVNNQVLDADTPFFVPFGTTTGTIRVNGNLVP